MEWTLKNVEDALAAGRLGIRMASGRVWAVRRNGQTKTWKTRPNAFSIPLKMGFRGHAYATQSNQDEFTITEA